MSAERAVREAGRSVLRACGAATAGLRPGPDFLIIGAKRGGTTSMYRYLAQHPDVLPLFPSPQHIKGVHYFDTNAHRGHRWYRSHFPSGIARSVAERRTDGRVVVGEASPYYLFHPLAAERAAAEVPDARIIVLLRDPVERAFSHWKERVRHDAESLSFADALAAERERLDGEEARLLADPTYRSYPHEHHSYLAQGLYLTSLRRWLSRYRSERVLILRSEDLYADPQSVYDRVLSFLGLRSWTLREPRAWNYHPAEDMDLELRDRLRRSVADHNLALEDEIGMELGWPGSSRATDTGRPGGSR